MESALKKLNLGVSAWVKLSGSTNNFSDNWWTRDVGYAKIRDKWGVALRTASGNYAHPDDESSEEWPFSEAPRWMRAEAVNKLPDLLEALLSKALETTKGLTSKTAQVYELTAAIDAVAKEPEPERPW